MMRVTTTPLSQLERVFHAMRDGEWRSAHWIASQTGDPVPSVAARLRDLRKQPFGAYQVERRRSVYGWSEYRLLPPSQRESGQSDMFA